MYFLDVGRQDPIMLCYKAGEEAWTFVIRVPHHLSCPSSQKQSLAATELSRVGKRPSSPELILSAETLILEGSSSVLFCIRKFDCYLRSNSYPQSQLGAPGKGKKAKEVTKLSSHVTSSDTSNTKVSLSVKGH